jgi:NAD(P)-dependent dehydrogenase (short-subunit alcohol dehydrogenase family)
MCELAVTHMLSLLPCHCCLKAGHLALPFWSAYNCSKAGLDMLSECLRYELADQGIAVVNVKPGPVRTPIWDKSRKKSQSVLDGMPAEMQPLYGSTIDKVIVCHPASCRRHT